MKTILCFVPKISTVVSFAVCVLMWQCSNPAEDKKETFPTTINGIVKNTYGVKISGAKVTLPTDSTFHGITTNANGFFSLTGFSAKQHRIKIEMYGYEIFEADVPPPVNSISTINPVLTEKTYVIPAVKPVGTGAVRLNSKQLETDFDGDGIYTPFVVKGAAFSPVPIGSKTITTQIYDRCAAMLAALNANTVRTYSGVDKYFLTKAAQNNIRVIVGFWVDLNLDLSNAETRQNIINEFSAFVFDLKDYSGVLMWNIGNEQNYSSAPNNGNSAYWYSLVQEMAIAAYKVEGAKYHPVCASNGNIYNIGNTAKRADDSSMSYVDLWGSNAYEKDFNQFFSKYRTASLKPIVITEFGIDALNNTTKAGQETAQALYDSTNWSDIRKANDVCIGATVFEFTDEWWKAGSPDTHDYGGYSTGAHPDGYANEEWWGLIEISPDADNDGMDEWRTRKAFEMFQRQWK